MLDGLGWAFKKEAMIMNNTKLIEGKTFKEVAKKIENLDLADGIFIKDVKKIDGASSACYLVIFARDMSSSFYGIQSELSNINGSMYALS